MKCYIIATIILFIGITATVFIADLINADRSQSIINYMLVYICLDTIVRRLKERK